MVHALHTQMIQLLLLFYSLFVRSGDLPAIESGVKNIVSFDVTNESMNHLPLKRLSVGPHAYLTIQSALHKKAPWVGDFLEKLKKGYVQAAQFMKTKLPLRNKTITYLCALDPSFLHEDVILTALLHLGESLPYVVKPEELGFLDEEIRSNCADAEVSALHRIYKTQKDVRIDVNWWSLVFKLTSPNSDAIKFPVLSKLVKALLALFTGPLVEGSFNLMDDVLRSDRSSLNTETYEALAIIKSSLHMTKKNASTMDVDSNMTKSCLSSYHLYQSHLLRKKTLKADKQKKKLQEAVKIMETQRAKLLITKGKRRKKEFIEGPRQRNKPSSVQVSLPTEGFSTRIYSCITEYNISQVSLWT